MCAWTCSCKIARLISFAGHALTFSTFFSVKYKYEIKGLQAIMKAKSQDISRSLLRAGATLAIATALSACASKPGPWPARALPANAAVTVDATQFLSRKQLVDWQYDLDDLLLRATGSPRHEAYIDVLHERLARAGVKQLRFEPVSLRQWSVEAEHWGLEVLDGERPGVLTSAGYIPYSGVAPLSGISGRIAYLAPNTKPDASLAGKLVLVEMPKVAWTGQVFHQTAVHVHDPEHAIGPDTPYARPFQMLGLFILLLDDHGGHRAAGADAQPGRHPPRQVG